MYRELIIMVEGHFDRLFFERFTNAICPEKTKCSPYTWNHPNKRGRSGPNTERICRYVNTAKRYREKGIGDYIFVADIDKADCVQQKKEEIVSRFMNVEPDRILIVIKEIESWYLAGIDDSRSIELNIPNFTNTDSITKEDFLDIIPPEYETEIDFRMELLDSFKIPVAIKKNKSFKYFFNSSKW